MTAKPNPLLAPDVPAMEPASVEIFAAARADYAKQGKAVPHETMMQIYAISQAESMKRIADALWGIEGTSGLLQLLNPLDVRNNY